MNDFYNYIAKKIYRNNNYCLYTPIATEVEHFFLAYAATLVENSSNIRVALYYPYNYEMTLGMNKLNYTNSNLIWNKNQFINISNGSSLTFFLATHNYNFTKLDHTFVFLLFEDNGNYKPDFLNVISKRSNKVTINLKSNSFEHIIKKHGFIYDAFTMEEIKNIKKIERKEKLKNIF